MLGVLLVAGGCLPAALQPLPTEMATLPAPNIALATSLPTATFTPSATETPTASSSPTAIPSGTSTSSATPSPSETPVVFRYVFPIQPASLAAFAPGGHAYPATDLFAPEGTRYVAVTDGVIDFVSYTDLWDPAVGDMAVAGGLCVAFIGDDGVRYYGSHLSRIADGIQPGARVGAGQLLGYVGHTGNAATTPSHVHFGISHPTYPEDWKTRRGEVDPIPFLEAWRAGINATPPLTQP
jgi:murein DD-endopeptidase MepM/ murein hydrolase activator NlpD